MSRFAPAIGALAPAWLTVVGVTLIVVGVTLLVLVDAPRRALHRVVGSRRHGWSADAGASPSHGPISAEFPGATGSGATGSGATGSGATGSGAHPPPLGGGARQSTANPPVRATVAPRSGRRRLGR